MDVTWLTLGPVFQKHFHFCQITRTDGCEFKPLLNKSAVRVFQQKEEEKVSKREPHHRIPHIQLLEAIGIDVESLLTL